MKSFILIFLLLAVSVSADMKTFDNDTDIEDSELLQGNADLNRGAVDPIRLDNTGADMKAVVFILRKSVWDSLGVGVTIDSAIIFIRCAFTDGTVRDAFAYGIWKQNLRELEVTWNDFLLSDNEWGTAGCNSTNDAGSFNVTDGGGDDRQATPFATVGIETSGTFQEFICTSWMQTCYDADEDMSVLIRADEAAVEFLDSREDTTPANRSYVEVFFTPGGPGADIFGRRKNMMKGN